MSKLIRIETEKTLKEVIEEIKIKSKKFNFIIRDIFNMGEQFEHHGVKINENFEFYSIMLCNPQKAYNSISESNIRGAVLLPPKQVVIYKENKKTIISYVAVEEKDVKEILPEDEKFQKGLSESCKKIVELIKEVK